MLALARPLLGQAMFVLLMTSSLAIPRTPSGPTKPSAEDITARTVWTSMQMLGLRFSAEPEMTRDSLVSRICNQAPRTISTPPQVGTSFITIQGWRAWFACKGNLVASSYASPRYAARGCRLIVAQANARLQHLRAHRKCLQFRRQTEW